MSDRMLNEPLITFCRGNGCPRADLCRRHMEAHVSPDQVYFDKPPLSADGQCAEFVANGWSRSAAMLCGGAHPPPRCAWQCSIEDALNEEISS